MNSFINHLDHWIWLVPVCMLGACIGSFLNVVIYRVPLGLSVNEPKRSFCPQCRAAIPMSLNLPLISWLWLRGKCRECKEPIPFRYFAVELLTAVLFGVTWWHFIPQAPVAVVGILCVLMALWVAISFIDAEHMIIPLGLTWAGSVLGLLGCVLWPRLPVLAGEAGSCWQALLKGGIGWVVGFIGLGIVVELGKLALGKKKLEFATAEDWSIREPETDQDAMKFEIGGEVLEWWDVFNRKSDRLLVEAADIVVDGESVGGGQLTIRQTDVIFPDGEVRSLARMKSLSGTATQVVVPREAMGMGDVHLLAMTGAFFGWAGVVFSLFAGSVYAIVAAVFARVGFGRPLPFGPFLVLGAATWMFGGWRWFAWYLDFLSPLLGT